MRKTFVVDTNVLLHDPTSIFAFGDNDIVVPISVISELDNKKKNTDYVGSNAREVSRQIDKLRDKGSLSDGVELENGGTFRIEINNIDIPEHFNFDFSKTDLRILAMTYNIGTKSKDPVVLVTKDLNLRIAADVLKIKVEDFYNDNVDLNKLYTGLTTVELNSPDLIDEFYKNERVKTNIDLLPNQFCILKYLSSSALTRYYNGELYKLKYEGHDIQGISPRNKEQRFAFELLLDDSLPIVSLVGKAGSGKTLLALSAALHKTFDHDSQYDKILVLRSLDAVNGTELGYFPGDKEEKIRPWVQPIYDNLEVILGKKFYSYPIDKFIEFDVVSYFRGRSITNKYIIVDDTQNLPPKVIKTILTRVGIGSKIVFTGDPDPAQIDNPYLDENSNGIVYVVDQLKKENISGSITLKRGERSIVAEIASRLP